MNQKGLRVHLYRVHGEKPADLVLTRLLMARGPMPEPQLIQEARRITGGDGVEQELRRLLKTGKIVARLTPDGAVVLDVRPKLRRRAMDYWAMRGSPGGWRWVLRDSRQA